MKQVTVLLVGVGGYGELIANGVFDLEEEQNLKVVGAVDCNFDASPIKEELIKRNIPQYATMEEFYENNSSDLAILTTPIFLHEQQSICAMSNGSDCLCEKPVAATVKQAENMQKAAEKYNKKLHIGFQLSYMHDILKLKRKLISGEFGKILSASAMICWPRNKAYYSQRSGAGKIMHNGHFSLDSIAMNACAHYLHILFYLLGDKEGSAASPEKAEAILCRANDIETFDTAMIKFECCFIPVFFNATHSSERMINPKLKIICEKATVEINDYDRECLVRVKYNDGSEEKYEKSPHDIYEKIVYACECTRSDKKPVCDAEAASVHVKCVNALTFNTEVNADIETYEENDTIMIEGIDDLFEEAFAKNIMPWELTERFGKPVTVDFEKSVKWGD